MGITAVCGFGATGFLTRMYPIEAVGLSAAAVSVGGLIDFITQFGVNYSLPRFLPTSSQRTALINTLLTMTMLATLVGTLIFLVLPVSDEIVAAGGSLFIVLFVLGTVLDVGETNLAAVFVADRSSDRIARASVAKNLVKLAAPAALVFLGMSGAYLSRIIAGVVEFLILAAMLVRRGHRFRPTLSRSATRELLGFSAGAYVGNLLAGLPLLIMPMLVLSRFGTSATAYWYTAMAIASMLTALPGSVSRALLAEVSHRPSERRQLVRRSAMLMGLISVPVLTVAYLVAPFILDVLGSKYAVGSLGALRWLILAGLVSGINYIAGNVLYIAKKTPTIAVINGIDALIVLGLAATWARNPRDIAIAWGIGEISNSILFASFAVRSLQQVGWRWEVLGDDGGESGVPVAGTTEPQAQQEGLELLFHLASLQEAGMGYGPGRFPVSPRRGGAGRV